MQSLEILFEDQNLLFMNKPARIPTIPGVQVKLEDSYVGKVTAQLECELWVVHRLDAETSGVIVFAKNADAHRDASMAFQNRLVKKKYLFISEGIPSAPLFKSNLKIDGKNSLTQFRVLKKYEKDGLNYFKGEAIPLTGRKHQIRIHLASLGFPILGDGLYGKKRNLPHFFLHNQLLHLEGLEAVEAPLPLDWGYWLEESCKTF